MQRILGRFGNANSTGALVVVFAAVHGNEPAGVKAILHVLDLLQNLSLQDPTFRFQGRLLALMGNIQAYTQGLRYIQTDLNRMWKPSEVTRILMLPPEQCENEEAELAEIVRILKQEINSSPYESLTFLDLHTTSAGGGVFSIPVDENGSLHLAQSLQAPVILGLSASIEGSLLRYVADPTFQTKPARTRGVAFEAGQNQDAQSVSRSVAVILECLRTAGCLQPGYPATPQDAILQDYVEKLPGLIRLVYTKEIQEGDGFRMRPGYENFQAIVAGEHLADDAQGPVYAPFGGLILMPLYQPKGVNGFFIAEEVKPSGH